MTTPNEPPSVPSDVPKKKRGCLFKGCLAIGITVGFLMLIFVLLMLFALQESHPPECFR